MRTLLSALLAWLLCSAGAAQAAVVQPFDHTVEIRLVSHTALELASGYWSEEGHWVNEICRFGQSCFASDFRPPQSQSPIPILESAIARFWRTANGKFGCEINGKSLGCNPVTSVGPNSSILSYFFCCSSIGSLNLNLAAGTMIYQGDAGSYRPISTPGCRTVVANFCDYSGVRTEYQVTSVGVSAIPLPASAWLLLAAVGGIWALACRKRLAA